MVFNVTSAPAKASGTGTSTPPAGMTKEEAERLVREAYNRNKEAR